MNIPGYVIFCGTALLAALIAGCSDPAPETSAPDFAVRQPSPPRATEAETKAVERQVNAVRESVDSQAELATQQAEQAEAARLLGSLTDHQTGPSEWDVAHAELLSLGPAAVPTLAEGLTASAPSDREIAASLLALLGTDARSAASQLIAALDDSSPFVRANAATALVQFDDHAAHGYRVLVELSNASDEGLRQMARANLAQFAPEIAAGPAVVAGHEFTEPVTPDAGDITTVDDTVTFPALGPANDYASDGR